MNGSIKALDYAACYGHRNVVELLLDRGADHSIPDKKGLLPIHLAAAESHSDIVKLLLHKRGSAWNERDEKIVQAIRNPLS